MIFTTNYFASVFDMQKWNQDITTGTTTGGVASNDSYHKLTDRFLFHLRKNSASGASSSTSTFRTRFLARPLYSGVA